MKWRRRFLFTIHIVLFNYEFGYIYVLAAMLYLSAIENKVLQSGFLVWLNGLFASHSGMMIMRK